jgi:streptomycin 6-kinase
MVRGLRRWRELERFSKIGMPHMEGEHEIDGLRFWDGDPTVRLLMADDDLGAMLLERCEPGTVLRALPEW